MKIKQVIVMRTDLNMRKGKMIAQGAHASMKVFFDVGETGFIWRVGQHGLEFSPENDPSNPGELGMLLRLTPEMVLWVEGLFTKVCVQVDNEEALHAIVAEARVAGLPVALIEDSGATEFSRPCHLCQGRGTFAPAVADRDAFGNKCPNCNGEGRIPQPTVTCCAVGPADAEAIDRITGGLKLL